MTSISAKAQSILKASPPEVFNAITDTETMKNIWFTRREVNIKAIKSPELLQLEWKTCKQITQVVFRLEETKNNHTHLAIEETGFKGSEEEKAAIALDSTGNLNYVMIALKAHLSGG